jgi:hypothetical protein
MAGVAAEIDEALEALHAALETGILPGALRVESLCSHAQKELAAGQVESSRCLFTAYEALSY